jgi:hypothetical protein
MESNILNELDLALEDLRAARERLGQLLPPSAHDGEEELRVNAAAWEQAQRALANALEKVEAARIEIRRVLSE